MLSTKNTNKRTRETKDINITQLNLGHAIAATDTLIQEAYRNNTKLLLLQDPYAGVEGMRGVPLKHQLVQHTTHNQTTHTNIPKAVIVSLCDNITLTPVPTLITTHMAGATTTIHNTKYLILSIYVTEDMEMEDTLEYITQHLRPYKTYRKLIGGDFNAWSTTWGSKTTDSRGEHIEQWMATHNLHTANTKITPTFQSHQGSSYIDLTLCDTRTLTHIDNWIVNTDENLSDHNSINYTLTSNRPAIIDQQAHKTTRIFNTRGANWENYTEDLHEELLNREYTLASLENIEHKSTLDTFITGLNNTINKVCHKHFSTNTQHSKQKQTPWWSPELQTLKNKLTAIGRRTYRCKNETHKTILKHTLTETRKEYKKLISNTKQQSWKDFCVVDQRNPYGTLYNMLKNSFKRKQRSILTQMPNGKPPETDKDAAQHIATHFFGTPLDNHTSLQTEPITQNTQPHQATNHIELQNIIDTMPDKEPGPDGLTKTTVTHIFNTIPALITTLYNKCLELGLFPSDWKEARVVLFTKKQKIPDSPAAFRPISLLNIFGKIYEKLILHRLQTHLDLLPHDKQMSTAQYGFTKQKSTEDACHMIINTAKQTMKDKNIMLAISLDVKGAFDNTQWEHILTQLKKKQTPTYLQTILASYFKNRHITLNYNNRLYPHRVYKGCPQGSCLSPQLWIIIMDDLLQRKFPDRCQPVAFADDLVLLIEAKSSEELQEKADKSIEVAQQWANSFQLSFNTNKSTATLFTKKIKYNIPQLHINNETIKLQDTFKYLGIIIDKRLNWAEHIKYIHAKTRNTLTQLSRVASNTWGLDGAALRTIYKGALIPALLYNCSVWGAGACFRFNRNRLRSLQRLLCLRLGGLYRTVSYEVAVCLTDTSPILAHIEYFTNIYKTKQEGHYTDGTSLHTIQLEKQITTQRKLPKYNIKLPKFTPAGEQSKYELYTDGSKLNDKTGAGFCCINNNNIFYTKQIKLQDKCSVFQAELYAIQEALAFLVSEIHPEHGETVTIFTDSQAAQKAIHDINTKHTIVNEIHTLLNTLNNIETTHIVWIKAHAGNKGNEEADRLAKNGTKLKTQPQYTHTPIANVKQDLKQTLRTQLIKIFNNMSHIKPIKQAFDTQEHISTFLKYYKPTYIESQFLTGHGKFKEYLQRFNITTENTCHCQEKSAQTPQHLLVHCTQMWHHKQHLHARLRADGIYEQPNFKTFFDPKYYKYTKIIISKIHADLVREEQKQLTLQTEPTNTNT